MADELDGVAAALLQTAGNLVTTAVSDYDSYKYSNKLMNNQADRQRIENEFYSKNAPEWNKEGLMAAGFNPALLSGSPGGIAGSSVSPPGMTFTPYDVSDTMANVAQAMNLDLIKAQAYKIRQEGRKSETEADYADAQMNQQLQEGAQRIASILIDNYTKSGMSDSQIEASKETLRELMLRNDYQEIVNMYEDSYRSGLIHNMTLEGNKLVADIKKVTAETDNIKAQTNRINQLLPYEKSQLNASIQYQLSEVGINRYEVSKMSWDALNSKNEAELTNIYVEAKKKLGPNYYMWKTIVDDALETAGSAVSTAKDAVTTSNLTKNPTKQSRAAAKRGR